MYLSDKIKQITLVMGLAGALLLIWLVGLTIPQAIADVHSAAPVQNFVGINGASCAYHDVATALIYATDGDTIYVSDVTSTTHTGLIGRIEHDLTFVAATDNCQTRSTTEAYLDGGGSSWAPSGGLAVISSTKVVTFEHIRLQNARALLRGGVVYVEPDASLVLVNSYVLDGEVGRYGGGVYISQGGSLMMSDSVVDTSEMTETGISLGGGGGVYINGGVMTMTNGSWVGRGVLALNGNTSAQDGGGIYLDGGSLYMHDSWVLNNLAVEGGGGVMAVNGASIQLDGVSLIGADSVQNPRYANRANDGGGVYLDGGAVMGINDFSEIKWNSAVNSGGGIYANGDSVVGIGDYGQIYSNTATFGGGAFLTGTDTIFSMFGSNTRIEGNQAIAPIGPSTVANGGGALVSGGASFYLGQGKMITNSATLLGGGIYVAQDGVADPTFIYIYNGAEIGDNAANYGGGLYIAQDGSDVTLDDTLIQANTAITHGGGIRINGDSTLVLQNGTVVSGNRTLNGHGGGLAMAGGRVEVADSLMEANLAGFNGGAIRQEAGLLTVTNTSLVTNSAYSGGGLGMFSASAVLTNVKVISNYGSNTGGGIALAYSDLTMGASFGADCNPSTLPSHTYCSEVRGNTSAGVGAGVYVGVGLNDVSIADTAFLDNENTSFNRDGAALSVGEGVVTLTNGLVSGNGANSNSAVEIGPDAAFFSTNSTYAGNQDVPLSVDSQATVTLTLNIIWSNTLPADIQGSLSSRCNDTQVALGGSGDVSVDPQFINLRGPYRLGPGSPAIDTCIGSTDHDLDGKPRPINAHGGLSLFIHDMGAFEAHPPVFIPLVLRSF